MMAEAGPRHQTLYYGDCLDWMGQWADECVDLIYLDPPFNSNADYSIIFGDSDGVPAQVRGFEDTWRWDAAAMERSNRLERAVAHPAHGVARAFRTLLGDSGMLAYLTYMAERLAEMRRILKPTGAIYLHCDDTAGHYLNVLMDNLFKPQNRLNTLTWRRATSHNDAKRYGRIADTILFYQKSDEFTWQGDSLRVPLSGEDLNDKYPLEDERGQYYPSDLTGQGTGQSRETPSSRPWRNYDVFELGRHWAVPRTGAYAKYINDHLIPGYDQIEGIHERLDALDAADMITHPIAGRWPGLKRYAAAEQGAPPQSIILNPKGFTNYSTRSREYLEFPTQKPLALLRQFIQCASVEGDFVLDPFCGCGTTMMAAHELGREWAGIDISSAALDIVKSRRLTPNGIGNSIAGIPIALNEARRLAADNPLDFEAWAVMRVPGLAANSAGGADSGIDGRGLLLNRPEDHESRTVLAQVDGAQQFRLSKFRDFLHVIDREEEGSPAAIGIYITLDRVTSNAARREALAAGTIKIGATDYPRLVLWSIEDLFDGQMPNIPVLADPYTGQPAQGLMFGDQ